MSDGIDMDGALEALSAQLPDDNLGTVTDEVDSVVEDNQHDVESFTGFDPSLLPEDMQAVYRSMQGDYTRKTQEVADLRRREWKLVVVAGVQEGSWPNLRIRGTRAGFRTS